MSAGNAKTESFNLGAATVMIGPKDNVLDLTPEKHSIGLVKNFTFSANDQYLDLTQGIRNSVVYSVKTGSEITASMEVYEYTPKNIAYALGLEGYDLVEGADLKLKEAIKGNMATTEIQVSADKDSTGDDFMIGDYVVMQGARSSKEDLVFIGKLAEVLFNPGTVPQIGTDGNVHDMMIALTKANGGVPLVTIEKGHMKVLAGSEQSITCSAKFKKVFGITEGERGPLTGSVLISASDKLSTLTFANNDDITISIDGQEVAAIKVMTSPKADTSAYFTMTFDRPVPEGFDFEIGDRVHKVNLIPVGSAEAQPSLAAKIVGILPEGKKPITLIIPKLRITNGFSLGFQTDQYGNMPFEFTPLEQIPSDPLYKEYGNQGFAFVLD